MEVGGDGRSTKADMGPWAGRARVRMPVYLLLRGMGDGRPVLWEPETTTSEGGKIAGDMARLSDFGTVRQDDGKPRAKSGRRWGHMRIKVRIAGVRLSKRLLSGFFQVAILGGRKRKRNGEYRHIGGLQ